MRLILTFGVLIVIATLLCVGLALQHYFDIASAIANAVGYYNTKLLIALSFFSLVALIVVLAINVCVVASIPGAVWDFLKGIKNGFVAFMLGADNKWRILPLRSDGSLLIPDKKPYDKKYLWLADSSSFYPIHNAKGAQATVCTSWYAFPLDGKMLGAIAYLRKHGIMSLEQLRSAVKVKQMVAEFGGIEKVMQYLESLKQAKEVLENASEEAREIVKQLGVRKPEEALELINREINTIEEGLRLYDKIAQLESVGALSVKAEDVITYLGDRHNVQKIKAYALMKVNETVERIKKEPIEALKQWMPLILVAGIVIIGILAAIAFLRTPEVVVVQPKIVNTTTANATTTTVIATTTVPQASIPPPITITETIVRAAGG